MNAVGGCALRALRRVRHPVGALRSRGCSRSSSTVAKVNFHVDVPLDAVDDRLIGVVCPVNVPVLVGESGGSAAMLDAPRRGTSAEETQQFVRVLIAHDQLAFDSGAAPQRHPSHVVRDRDDGQKELRRVAFAC